MSLIDYVLFLSFDRSDLSFSKREMKTKEKVKRNFISSFSFFCFHFFLFGKGKENVMRARMKERKRPEGLTGFLFLSFAHARIITFSIIVSSPEELLVNGGQAWS